MTIAKTRLTDILLIYSMQYHCLYGVNNPCYENRLNLYRHCSSTAFQSRFFIVFSSNLFSSHTLGSREWACGLWFNIIWYACFSHISAMPLYILMKLVTLFTLCILYKQSDLQG